MKLAWLIVLAAGCHPGMADDYPILPGGDDEPPISPGTPDAAVSHDAPAGSTLQGRICLVADLRQLETCASTGAGGLTVSLGTQVATTAADGTFSIASPAGTTLTWHVSGGAIVPSVMSFGAVSTIPAVTATTYSDLLTNYGLILVAGQGSIVTRVVHAAAGVTGATATASPIPLYPPYYDGTSATIWDQDSTGPFGVVWFAGAGVGSVSVSITPAAGSPVVTASTIEDQAITFVTVELP